MGIPINFPYPRTGNVELFDYYKSTTIANGASGDILNVTTPRGFKRGFVTLFGHGIDNPAYFLGSIFSIRVNGINDRYYEAIADQLAPFNEPREIAPIKLNAGDILSVFVVNNNATPALYAARLRGFFDNAFGDKG